MGKPGSWALVESLLLAVEIISPSSVHIDRIVKRDFYLSAGVSEYWIVDLDARMVERWTPERETPEVLRTSVDWFPAGAGSSLTIDLAAMFELIWTKYRRLAGR